jgi:single-stranded DNA-binding protein
VKVVERGLNKFTFIGNVNEEVKLLDFDGDLKRYSFSLVIPEHAGDSVFYEYRDVFLWGELGSYMYENLTKMSSVYVEGRTVTKLVEDLKIQEFHATKVSILQKGE